MSTIITENSRHSKLDYDILLAYIQALGIPIFNVANHLICSFHSDDEIGRCSTMTLCRALLHQDPQQNPIEVALELPNRDVSANDKDEVINEILATILQEIRIMKYLETHPHIVSLYGVTFQDLKPILVVELASANMADYLTSKKATGDRVNWERKAKFCQEVADGIKALHAIGIVHGGIKADSVFLFSDTTSDNGLISKISGFGYSSNSSTIGSCETREMLNFLAPECTPMAPPEMKLYENDLTKDNYSFGLYVWQVATDGEIPYVNMNANEIDVTKHSDKELQKLMQLLPEDTPRSLQQMIIDMTQYEPKKRKDLIGVKGLIIDVSGVDPNEDVRYTETKEFFEVSVQGLSQDTEGTKFWLMPIPALIKERLIHNYEVAASEGDTKAAYYLSMCYGSGFGVKLDKAKMISWAIRAAEGGCLDAVKNIATSSRYNIDQLPDNRTLLFPWILKAAEDGHTNSQYVVSQCYKNGFCVEEDQTKYWDWFERWVNTTQMAPESGELLLSESALHSAAREGDTESIKFFIQQESMYVDTKDISGATPLHLAASQGHTSAIMLFIESKADVNAKDNDGRTPLSFAVQYGQVETVKLLAIELKADTKIEDKNGWTLLHFSAQSGHVEVANLLITEFGADVHAKNNDGHTPLHTATQNGHVKIVELVAIKFGADVNIQDNAGWTPLHLATQNGHVELVKLLVIKFGANVNAKSNNGLTPLHLSALFGHVKIVRMLLTEFGADMNTENNSNTTPVQLAAQNGNVDIVKLLVTEFEADVNIEDTNGWTLLHLAAQFGHIEVVNVLVIEFGANADAKNNDGLTPLHLAAQFGQAEVAKLLVTELGADVDAKDNDCTTPIHLAIQSEHTETIRLLATELGADANAKNNNNTTPLHIATRNGHVDIVKLLVTELGADVNVKDSDDWTPLHLAAQFGHVEVVFLLAGELMADMNAVDSKGRTPLFFCVGYGHIEVMLALLEHFHAEANVRSEGEETLLHLAVKCRQESAIKMLVEQFHLDIHAKDTNGRTPLELADELPVHFGIYCDICKIESIVGELYRCTACADLDVCSACYPSLGHDPEHIFDMVELPSVNHILLSYC